MIIEITIGIIGIGLTYYLVKKKFNSKIEELEKELKKYKFDVKSAYVKFGKSFENFVPFIKDFPGVKENTCFLGMPIDFISFDKDSIKFIEVKTGTSQLSPKQKYIRKQIEDGNVEFEEVRY